MKKIIRKLFPSKEMRAYRKMYRRHRKELVDYAKKIREWDYGWLHDGVIMQIRHMYEYYTAGNNVYQSDESENKIIEQLKHVLDLQNKLDNVWEEWDRGHIQNEDGSIAPTEKSADSYRTVCDKETALYEEIYSYIGKNIQWWWD